MDARPLAQNPYVLVNQLVYSSPNENKKAARALDFHSALIGKATEAAGDVID